jgi:hypothetical protein
MAREAAVSCSSFGRGPGKVAPGAVMVFGACLAEVSAPPLTPFRDEAQAQRYCPGDMVVWLDLRKGSTADSSA